MIGELDFNALLMSGVVGLAVFFVTEMRRPGRQQQQMLLMGVMAAGAYLLREFEGRGNQQESFAVQIASLDAKNEERFRTAFNDIHDIKTTMKELVERLPHRQQRRR